MSCVPFLQFFFHGCSCCGYFFLTKLSAVSAEQFAEYWDEIISFCGDDSTHGARIHKRKRTPRYEWVPFCSFVPVMRAALDDFDDFTFYAVDDTVCFINSSAPIGRQVAAQSFRLTDAFIPVAVNVPKQLKNSPERLPILSRPILEVLPCFVRPCLNHPDSPHGWFRRWIPFVRWTF